jgi:hypothetical protein
MVFQATIFSPLCTQANIVEEARGGHLFAVVFGGEILTCQPENYR